MSYSELERSFAQTKNNILRKIQASKDKWQKSWEEAQGIPSFEAELIQLNLQISLVEVEALNELAKMDEKIRKTMGKE